MGLAGLAEEREGGKMRTNGERGGVICRYIEPEGACVEVVPLLKYRLIISCVFFKPKSECL